jgi:hypothetical protein
VSSCWVCANIAGVTVVVLCAELRLARDQIEEDPRKLETRQRQIQFGKNTIGYDNYISAVPK